MQARHRELVRIARDVDGVEILDHYTTNGRAEVHLRAPNGVGHKFFLSLRGGLRDAVNVQNQIKRFARENVPPTEPPAPPATPDRLIQLKEAMSTVPTPARTTLTVAKKPEPIAPVERALTNVEIWNFTQWLRNSTLMDYATAEAAAAAASIALDCLISETVLRNTISITKSIYPTAWDKPLDAVTVLADQLAAVMAALDITPTDDFVKLAKQLHKE